jgi:antitoxin YefM
MITTYRLNEKELSDEVIHSIKKAFMGKEIEIIVSEVPNETNYLLSTESNKKHIYPSIEDLENGKRIPLTLAELQEKYLK